MADLDLRIAALAQRALDRADRLGRAGPDRLVDDDPAVQHLSCAARAEAQLARFGPREPLHEVAAAERDVAVVAADLGLRRRPDGAAVLVDAQVHRRLAAAFADRLQLDQRVGEREQVRRCPRTDWPGNRSSGRRRAPECRARRRSRRAGGPGRGSGIAPRRAGCSGARASSAPPRPRARRSRSRRTCAPGCSPIREAITPRPRGRRSRRCRASSPCPARDS